MIPSSTARPSTWWNDRRVSRVRRVATVGAAERDDVDGRLLRLHRADLRGRRLRAQHGLVVEKDARERRARRMPRREVERVEVVPGRLDLATVDDRVAEPEEDVLDLAADLRDQVQMARAPSPRPAASRRPALPRGAGRGRHGQARSSRASIAVSRRSRSGVEGHTGLAVANVAQRLLERALAAQVLDAHRLDRRPSTTLPRRLRELPLRAPAHPWGREGTSGPDPRNRLLLGVGPASG